MPAKARKLTTKQQLDLALVMNADLVERNEALTEKWEASERINAGRLRTIERTQTELFDARRLAADRLSEREELQLKLGRSITEAATWRSKYMAEQVRCGTLGGEVERWKEQALKLSHLVIWPPVQVNVGDTISLKPGAIQIMKDPYDDEVSLCESVERWWQRWWPAVIVTKIILAVYTIGVWAFWSDAHPR